MERERIVAAECTTGPFVVCAVLFTMTVWDARYRCSRIVRLLWIYLVLLQYRIYQIVCAAHCMLGRHNSHCDDAAGKVREFGRTRHESRILNNTHASLIALCLKQ